MPDTNYETQHRRGRLSVVTLPPTPGSLCQFLNPTLFAGFDQFEADEEAMRELWDHELEQNEAEAALGVAILAR